MSVGDAFAVSGSRVKDCGVLSGIVFGGEARLLGLEPDVSSLCAATSAARDLCILDSGANVHLTGDRSLFTGFVRKCRRSVGGIDSSSNLFATAVGKGILCCAAGVIPLAHLYYVPGMGKTLVSTSALVDSGFTVDSGRVDGVNTSTVRLGDRVVVSVAAVDGLYPLGSGGRGDHGAPAVWERDLSPSPTVLGYVATRGGKVCSNLASGGSFASLMHRRCGHVSWGSQHLAKAMRSAFGGKFDTSKLEFCEPCTLAKMRTTMSKAEPTRKATRPLARVHFDLSPSVPVVGIGDHVGFMIIVDEYSGMFFVRCIRAKSEVPDILQEFQAVAEKHFQEQIGVFVEGKVPQLTSLRSDNAQEHRSATMQQWCKASGISHEFSAPYSQWQNGKAERAIQTVWAGAEAMRKASGAPPRYWPLTLDSFVHVRNRLPLRSGGVSPHELWHSIRVPLAQRIAHLRVWGCAAYLLVPKALRKKLDDRARRCVFVGYAVGYKAYRLLDLDTGKFHVGVSVVFDEDHFPLMGLSDDEDRSSLLDEVDFGVHGLGGCEWDSALNAATESPSAVSIEGGEAAGVDDDAGVQRVGVSVSSPPSLEVVDDAASLAPADDRYLLDKVVGYRLCDSFTPAGVKDPFVTEQFKVRWVGYDKTQDTWQLASDIGAQAADDYVARCDKSVSRARASFPGRVLGFDYHPAVDELGDEPDAGDVDDSSSHAAILALNAVVARSSVVDTELHTLDDMPRIDDGAADRIVCARLRAQLGGPPLAAPVLARIRRRIDLLAMAATRRDLVPERYSDVHANINAPAWLDAMRSELGNFAAFGAWKLVPLPAGANKMSCRWVFAVKRDKIGLVKKLKARLCVRGFSQRHGVDYQETWAPTARMRVFRAMLAEASGSLDIRTAQWDCTNAFLHAAVDHDMFMSQPAGFVQEGSEDMVCQLLKAVYGTKQASRLFHEMVRSALLEVGAVQSEADECFFVLRDGEQWMKVCVHCDDFAVTYCGANLYARIFKHMQGVFKITDEGPISHYLGIAVSRSSTGEFLLSQGAYIAELLDRLGMPLASGASTTQPEKPGSAAKLKSRVGPLTSDEAAFMAAVPYRQAVGALFYLARATRMDIAHACSQVARFMAAPAPEHWHAVLRIYRYVARTRNVPLCLRLGKAVDDMTALDIKALVDADWAGCVDTRRSTTGWMVFFGSALVSWGTRRQGMVTQSSTEAEYVAASEASNELMWWAKLAVSFGYPPARMLIECDNKSAVILADHTGRFSASKHVETRFHVVRERVNAKLQEMVWVPDGAMLADVLTKNCQAKRFLSAASTANGSSFY